MDPHIERLIAILQAASARADQMTALLKQFTTATDRATRLDAARAAAKAMQTGLGPVIEQEQRSAAEGLEVAKQLTDAAPAGDQPVRAEDIASHFRALVETVQLDARRPREGEVATTLKSFDVEIKGLIVV